MERNESEASFEKSKDPVKCKELVEDKVVSSDQKVIELMTDQDEVSIPESFYQVVKKKFGLTDKRTKHQLKQVEGYHTAPSCDILGFLPVAKTSVGTQDEKKSGMEK